MIKAGASPEPPLRRPFSILTVDPEHETFTLFVKAVGQGSRALCSMREGEQAQCLGPLGRTFTLPGEGTEAVMVAGGYGIAPFRLFSEELAQAGGKGRGFYGGRTPSHLHLSRPFAPRAVRLGAV